MTGSVATLPDYEKIEQSLNLTREIYLEQDQFDENSVRPAKEAKIILNLLKNIQTSLEQVYVEQPSLVGLFNKEFGSWASFISPERINELCFIEDYLFSKKEEYPIVIYEQFNQEMLESYSLVFKEWGEEKISAHNETRDWIEEEFDRTVNYKSLSCNCVDCVADYRTKLRHVVYSDCLEIFSETKQWIIDNLETQTFGEISKKIFDLKKAVEKKVNVTKQKLKRGSIQKLEKQLQNKIKEEFGIDSRPAQICLPKIKELLKETLIDDGLGDDLITDEEYERFFAQQGLNLWRPEKYLKREFMKIVRAALMLKRKDISSSILQEYLGQFWLHSRARHMNRKIIYHMGPTNSGKTYHAVEALAKSKSGCYLAPLRLLAGELYDTLNEKDVLTTLLTGEEVIEVEGSEHFSSTIEMAKFDREFDCAVIDEIQMISDSQRGWAWTRALINIVSPVVYLCGDASALDLVKQILALTGDTLEIVEYSRMTELVVERRPITLASLGKGDALVVFSRRNALKYKSDLEVLGFKVSIVYGRLSPEVRREQARKFDEGETDIIVSTDAIAMGMNLPIKRIVFSTLSKFIDGNEIMISNSEIKQIAGRAGRYKRFPIGKVNCLTRVEGGLELVETALACDLEQSERAMVGPDLEIYRSVNDALEENGLKTLDFSEFLRLFNTMIFKKPFYCVDLKEMIEVSEMVEEADVDRNLSAAEIFGFACAPVNLGMAQHVQYYVWILNHYVTEVPITNEPIDPKSNNIDYLETSIKCVELFQWLSRHFSNKGFDYDEKDLIHNKSLAIEKLNNLLSEKIVRHCSSCGVKIPDEVQFNICEDCFSKRRFARRKSYSKSDSRDRDDKKKSSHRKKSKYKGKGKGQGHGKKKSTKVKRRGRR